MLNQRDEYVWDLIRTLELCHDQDFPTITTADDLPIEKRLFQAGKLTPTQLQKIERLIGGVTRFAPTLLELSGKVIHTYSPAQPEDPHPATHRQTASDTDNSITRSYSPAEQNKHGRFHVLRPFSQGGLGLVSVALDRELKREVALKEIRPDRIPAGSDISRFVFEGSITGKLEHPGIVPVYGMGTTEAGKPFYAMRLIRGKTLRQEIRDFHSDSRVTAQSGLLWLKKILARMVQVCRTLEYAHQQGIVHRDLKPANIMLGPHGETLVVDWGLAKNIARPDAAAAANVPATISNPEQTETGTVVGTIAFMSPEQMHGELDRINASTDVFGLGATLYAIFSGQAPYHGQERDDLLDDVRNARVVPVRQLAPWIPSPLAAICHKAISADQRDRYNSAESLATDLEMWLAGEPVGAYRENFYEKMIRFARNHRVLAGSLFVVAVTAAVFSLIGNGILTNKNRQIQSAQQQAESSRDLAQQTVIKLIDELDQKDLLKQKNSNNRKLVEEVFAFLKERYDQGGQTAPLVYAFARIAHYAGNLAKADKDFDHAASRYANAERAFSEVLRLETVTLDKRRRFANFCFDYAEYLLGKGTIGQAKQLLVRADETVAITGETPAARMTIAETKAELNTLVRQIAAYEGDFDLAVRIGREVVDLFSQLVEESGATLKQHIFLLANHCFLVSSLHSLDQHDEALAVAGRARELLKKPIYSADPTAKVSTQYYVAILNNIEAKVRAAKGEWQQVLELASASQAEVQSALSTKTDPAPYLPLAAYSGKMKAIAYRELGNREEANQAIAAAVEQLNQFINNPRYTDDYILAAEIYEQLALLAPDDRAWQEAREQALAWVEKAIAKAPDSKAHQSTKDRLQANLQARPR